MARIALIDDDPTEAMILEGMLEYAGADHEMTHATSLAGFAAEAGAFDLVLLDRRLPPYEDFSESLPALAQTGWRGPVVLITAFSDAPAPDAPDGLTLIGPVNKGDLLSPEAVSALITRALS